VTDQLRREREHDLSRGSRWKTYDSKKSTFPPDFLRSEEVNSWFLARTRASIAGVIKEPPSGSITEARRLRKGKGGDDGRSLWVEEVWDWTSTRQEKDMSEGEIE
jgi:hypothetical protein